MTETSKQLLVRALAAVALALAACSADVAGQIPCADDASCPSDYPVCGPSGKCIAGTSTASNSVAFVGADGHTAADFLSGTVRVLVSARASTGVKSVSLASSGVPFPASATAAAPPVYAFDVNTTSLADGDATLTATLTAGDGTTTSANGTLHVDNAKPAISTFTVDGGASTTITSGRTAALTATFSGGTAIVTAVGGGSASLTSGATLLVSPDANTTYTLTVTSRSGVSAQTGTSGQPANVSVTVVPAKVPTITSFAFQSSGLATATFNPGDDVVLDHVYDAKGGTATINAVPAGLSGATTTFSNIGASTVYRLTVTSPDGVSVFSDVTATVRAKVDSFSAGATLATSSGTTTITTGGTTNLFAFFRGSGATGNGVASVSCGPSCNSTLPGGNPVAVSSGSSIAVSGNQNGALTYTLTVTPSSGPVATATATVNVVPQANATSLTASSTFVHQGESTSLTPTFNFGASPALLGTATITGSDGSTYAGLTSGTPVPVAPQLPSVTYTLHVFNAAGAPAATAPTATVILAPGSWSALNMNTFTVRRGATVTALDNGKVLIAGGADLANNPLKTADVCDATGACTATANGMGDFRAFHTAVKIPASAPNNGGKVLIAGGFTNATAGVLDTPTIHAQFYDPATNQFANATDITTGTVTAARARHIAVLLADGKTVLIAGGTDGATNLSSALKYDAGTNATPTTADTSNAMAQARASFTGTLTGATVLIVGGKTGSTAADRTAEIFDPSVGNGTFSNTGALPSGEDKRSHTAVLIGGASTNAGKVLISGGVTGAGSGTPSATQFLFSAGAFVSFTNLATARSNHAAISLPTDSVLLCGGTSDGTNTLQSCERYDPASGAGNMFPTAPMIVPRKDFALAPMTISSLVEIVAAGSPSSPFSYAEAYDSN